MANKWSKQLKAFDDAVDYKYDAFAKENCIFSPSPYVNWIFGNKSMGMPKGTGTIFFSEPKSGKSLIIQAFAQQICQEDDALIAAGKLKEDDRRQIIIFNSEMRGKFQTGLFAGINPDAMHIYDTNQPEEIFDRIEKEILPMIQDGMKIGFVAFDSITQIGGTKSMDGSRSVNDHLIGDKALTITKGWEKVIPIFKKHCIPYFGVEQMRKNIDASNPYAPKEKMAGVFATKHAFEYFVSIKRAGGKDDREDIEGNKFEGESVDARGNADQTGHKIYFKMEGSSLGTAGRAGVLTIDYKHGIINTHEEVFELGKNTGVINLQGQTYSFGSHSVRGQAAFALMIRDNPELYAAILEEVRKLDVK